MVTLEGPNASALNFLWRLFFDSVSLSEASYASPGCRVVQYVLQFFLLFYSSFLLSSLLSNEVFRLCVEDMLSALKSQIRNKLALKDVFSSSIVNQSLQTTVHAQLSCLFNSQMAVFTGEDVQKHCNRTNDVCNSNLILYRF